MITTGITVKHLVMMKEKTLITNETAIITDPRIIIDRVSFVFITV